MSLILEYSDNIRCSSNGFCNTINIGDYTISGFDFCVLIEYYLTNTDLVEDDLRINLIKKIKNYKIIDGYNKGYKRISLNNLGHHD